MVYVTYVISACICATAMIFFVSWGFWVRKFILTIATRVTLTYDLETQGHVMVLVTFVISGHLYVFHRNDFCPVSRSRNSNWLLPRAWPSCVTLKRKVPSWTTCFDNLTNKKSRRQWRDLRFSRSMARITQLAIVRINSLHQKPYEQKNNHLGWRNTSRNNKSHVDCDVTFSFKVTRDGHANGDSC